MYQIIIDEVFALWGENGRQTQTKGTYSERWMPEQPKMNEL